MPAIRFDDVSKRFKVNTDQADSVLDTIVSTFSRSRSGKRHDHFLWAVKDVTFDVEPGEGIGLVGRNGSGKSTILKLASGIIRPSSGRVEIRGRLSALLELGAGFHPDLTGRENIWLNASILGLSNAEIAKVNDEIIDFAELGDLINMPVKHYSSGMYMRLGFSVAVHVNPDILLIDEILAVGDQSFQEKCIERLHYLKEVGTTVVFVSHSLETVRSLCPRILWIEKGHVLADGPADQLLDEYLASHHPLRVEVSKDDLIVPSRPVTGELELTMLRLLNAEGVEQDRFVTGEAMTIEVHYAAGQTLEEPIFGLLIYRNNGDAAGKPVGRLSSAGAAIVAGTGVVRCHVDRLPLEPADYQIFACVYHAQTEAIYDRFENACSLRVVADPKHEAGGFVDIPASWEAELTETNDAVESAGPNSQS